MVSPASGLRPGSGNDAGGRDSSRAADGGGVDRRTSQRGCNVGIPFCNVDLTFHDPRPTPRPPGRRQDRPKPWRPGAPQAADAAAGARPCRAGAGEPAHPLRDCGRALQGTLGGLRSAGCATPCPLPVRQVAKRRSSVGDTRGNHSCPRDERRTSASAKQSASGSRADSGRRSTICCGAGR